VEPEFSAEARRAHWNGGDIDVTFTIDESGKATHMKVLNSPGMGLDEQVISALEQWRFSPKIQDGVPVVHGDTSPARPRHAPSESFLHCHLLGSEQHPRHQQIVVPNP
jgi:TonB family protein